MSAKSDDKRTSVSLPSAAVVPHGPAAACFLFIAFGTSVVINAMTEWAPGWLIDFVRSLSFIDHYSAIARGKLDLRDVIYFISVIVLFLFLNGVAVERSKASS